MLDISVEDLRALSAIAQRGSFTAAANELGYTQSAISKRIAALESAVGHRLVIRERNGARLARAGEVLLHHGNVALGALAQAERELNDGAPGPVRPVRLGAFASAAAGVVPAALARLCHERPDIPVTLREATSAMLLRALRAASIDLALLADVGTDMQPDDGQAPLHIEVLAEGPLRIAVGQDHRLAQRASISPQDLVGERWVTARSEGRERLLGVWPALPGRPDAPYVARDWLTKLRLVARSAAITTVPDVLIPALGNDVRAVAVGSGPIELRRLLLAYDPELATAESLAVAEALRNAA